MNDKLNPKVLKWDFHQIWEEILYKSSNDDDGIRFMTRSDFQT